jgi:hypothetical protein
MLAGGRSRPGFLGKPCYTGGMKHGPLILVVDDMHDVAEFLALLLKRRGFKTARRATCSIRSTRATSTRRSRPLFAPVRG